MGIKNLSKIFEKNFNEIILSYKDFNKYNINTIAIDISILFVRIMDSKYKRLK